MTYIPSAGPVFGSAIPVDITIHGFPKDTMSFKVRVRTDDVATVYVRRPFGMEKYYLLYDDITKRYYINQHYLIARNQRGRP